MLRRLFLVLQIVCVIPIIIVWFIGFIESGSNSYWYNKIFPILFFGSHIPYLITVLGKYIVYGKFHLYKIGEGNDSEENSVYLDNQGREATKWGYPKTIKNKQKKTHPREIIEEKRLRLKEEYYENLGREVLKIEEEEGNKIVNNSVDKIRKGYVKITLLDGNIFEGECNDGTLDRQINGQGTYVSPSGSKYEGEWKNGEMNGQGTFTWSDGDNYVGEFKNGGSHGQGTFNYNDGRKYVGEWKEDKWWKGIEYDKNGKIKHKFVNGNPMKE